MTLLTVLQWCGAAIWDTVLNQYPRSLAGSKYSSEHPSTAKRLTRYDERGLRVSTSKRSLWQQKARNPNQKPITASKSWGFEGGQRRCGYGSGLASDFCVQLIRFLHWSSCCSGDLLRQWLHVGLGRLASSRDVLLVGRSPLTQLIWGKCGYDE